jgi:hypothetical protein
MTFNESILQRCYIRTICIVSVRTNCKHKEMYSTRSARMQGYTNLKESLNWFRSLYVKQSVTMKEPLLLNNVRGLESDGTNGVPMW